MKIKTFGYDRHKMTELTYEELERLLEIVTEEHACSDGIYLVDAKGRKKIDAIGWAVYYKNKKDKANA
ncbi:hypothetical protein ACRPHP_07200 [Pantoea allii]|uniref:hypothetical protein n=1 Tax=Pantoea allii TaxID=574096 RepID=UPI003D7A1472